MDMNSDALGYLDSLQDRLWPKSYKSESPVSLTVSEHITLQEWAQVKSLIETHKLLTNIFCAGMFGAYGIDIYEHPSYPGTPPRHLLRVVEGNFPARAEKRIPGVGSTFAWQEFSRYTHTEENMQWLKEYKMEPPKSRGYYDY
jgi:hypothetical protein